MADIQHLIGHQRTTSTDTYLKSFMPNMDKLGAVLDEEEGVALLEGTASGLK